MFESYTAEAIREAVLANAPEGIDTRQGSIYYDAISGIVEQIARMYADLDLVFQYTFLATTSGDYLDMKASEYGLTRHEATAAAYYLVYEGTRPESGARFFHSGTGLYFYVDEIENDDGESILILVAEEAGTGANNIAAGDLAVPVNTIQGLISSTFGAVYVYGVDIETDDALRERVQEKISGPAENGNKQHYKTWCESVDGVGLARIVPLWNGPNTVKGVLITPEGAPCTESVVEAVQEYVDPASKGETVEIDGKVYNVGDGLGEGVANLGAHFTAVAADPANIAVAFTATLASTATTDSAATAVKSAIASYFASIALATEEAEEVTVYASQVGAIIANTDGVLDYQSLTLNGDTENITIGADAVPIVTEVTVNAAT